MSFTSQSRKILLTLIVGLVLMIVSAVPAAADGADYPVLTLRVGDTVGHAGDSLAWISVYLANYSDTVSGFSIGLLLDRQNIIEFRTGIEDTLIDTTYQYCGGWDNGVCTLLVDTLIIDTLVTTGAIDTSGSAISGWELVSAKSSSPDHRDNCRITALADKLGPPYTPGIPPSANERFLFKLKTRVFDSIADTNNIVNITLMNDLNLTSFSTPSGNLIGVLTDYSICDTFYLNCTTYPDSCYNTSPEQADSIVVDTFYRYQICVDSIGDSCTHWVDTTEAAAESIWIDPRPWTRRDTTTTFYADGSLEVLLTPPCNCCTGCGDANGDGNVNIGDAVFIVNYIFKHGPNPPNVACADPNNDNTINIGDAVFIVNFIFKHGPDPVCD